MTRNATTFSKDNDLARKAFHARISKRWREFGKRRWANMTQEEKDYVAMKRDYANAVRKKRTEEVNRKLKGTAFKVTKDNTNDEIDDIDNFFYGDVI